MVKTIPFNSLTTIHSMKTWVQSIFNNNEKNVSLKNIPEYNLIVEFIKRHPKINNVIDLKINLSPKFGNYCFYVKQYKDSEWEDFSYHICIQPHKYNNYKLDFNRTLRELINYQILDFKNKLFKENKNVFCEITDEEVFYLDSDVDHIIKFRDLVRNFVLENNITISKDTIERYDNKFILTDKDMADKWINFHLKNAKLRILLPEVNRGLH